MKRKEKQSGRLPSRCVAIVNEKMHKAGDLPLVKVYLCIHVSVLNAYPLYMFDFNMSFLKKITVTNNYPYFSKIVSN